MTTCQWPCKNLYLQARLHFRAARLCFRAMWLLDKMLRKLVKRGELIVIDHNGKTYRYGLPDPNHGPITVRLTDRRAAFDIAKDPRLGAGETYMDGRMVVEQGDILDLLLFARYNAPWERSGALRQRGILRRSASFVAGKFDQINW